MQRMNATDVVATFAGDAWTIVVAIILCTIAAMLLAMSSSVSAWRRSPLPMAGLFAAAYGLRLLFDTDAFALTVGEPGWLVYARSAMEYLVPIPGAALFARGFGARFRRWNNFALALFILCAVVAIPYELLARHPFAVKSLVDALVMSLMLIFIVNLANPSADEDTNWKPVRKATTVFVLFVLNEHLQIVRDPYGILDEPTGFLYLIGSIVYVLMQQSMASQLRLNSIDSELATARRIQLSTIPQTPPQSAHLQIAMRYEPASEVAGDFFDFHRLDDGRIGVLVADVSGHGVAAALVASMLKVAFATTRSVAEQPARVLHDLNLLFCGKLERQFITAAYAFIDPARELVTMASAGHPAALLLRGGTSAAELTAEGMILGRFPRAQFAQQAAAFRAGDALVLYTDGMTETLDANGEMWGERRLADALVAHGRLDAEEMAAALTSDVAAWSSRRDDDVTLVVLRRV